MDLSKLRKLSQTTSPRNDETPDAPEPQRQRDYSSEDPGDGLFATALDVFIALGVGVLFVFLGMDYARYLAKSPDAFPMPTPITGTGYVWKEGSPKAGKEVAPEELQEPYKTEYQDKVKGYQEAIVARNANIIGSSSLFYVGVALVAAGLLLIVSHVRALPTIARSAAGWIGVLATGVALAYGCWAIVVMFKANITPILTMVAILVGGMSLFMQLASVRMIGAGAAQPARRQDRSAEPGAARTASVSPVRTAHHRFAHQTLRQETFANPSKLVGILQGPGSRVHLADMWEVQNRAMGLSSSQNPSDGLHAEMTQVGPYSAAIVTMPPPQREGECYFVGIVLRSYKRDDGAIIERQPVVLYYTLEYGTAPAAGTTPAVLCEWFAGDHIRFADAVVPDFSAFREAMWQKVLARQTAEDQLAAQPRA
jgi:hypothetical protein